MRGRKPKPTALKILEGCRKDAINHQEPPYVPASTEPPGWLRGLAREHWDELAPLLGRLRVLGETDRPGLALLCHEYGRWRDDDTNASKDRYVRLLIEYGMTPSSRGRIKAAPEKPKDELQNFLEKKA
jgi:phage terminase small subunit